MKENVLDLLAIQYSSVNLPILNILPIFLIELLVFFHIILQVLGIFSKSLLHLELVYLIQNVYICHII